MVRAVGTTARGIRAPIIKEGDNLINIVVDSIIRATEVESFELNDDDIVGITESLVARAQGNYASIDNITEEINSKFDEDIGIVFPILSRNRFAIILKAIALSNKKIHLLLNYPSDEVGNQLMDIDKMNEFNINPHTDVLTEEKYRELFGNDTTHPFTGMDYVQIYKDLAINDNINIYFSNDPKTILNYTKDVLVANVHDRKRTKRILKESGVNKLYGLEDFLNEPKEGRGYNPKYGLLGSNLATKTELKLFPRDSQKYVDAIQKEFKKRTGRNIEVMVYGDGAFKDPVGRIWELADPIVSPGYTSGLEGTPNEIKLKYLVDTELHDLSSEDAETAIKEKIGGKDIDLTDHNDTLGTTPRRITDLLGSLCDLTSGSGDKGTPIVLIQGYFDNFATN